MYGQNPFRRWPHASPYCCPPSLRSAPARAHSRYLSTIVHYASRRAIPSLLVHAPIKGDPTCCISCLRMAQLKALYGRRFCTPVNYIEPGERMIFGPDHVTEAEEIVHHIQSNLKPANALQESYTNKRRRTLEFKVGDCVYLHVLPTRGVKRFGIKGKLAPRYIGPFLVLARLENVAYRLELPPTLAGVHNVFHISQLKKSLKTPVNVVVDDVTPIDADLSYPEHSVKVLDQQD
jgi:hypothetical protein